jgi:hypothetical protein
MIKTRSVVAAVVGAGALAIAPAAESGTRSGVAARPVAPFNEQCIQRNAIQMRNGCASQIEVVYDVASSCQEQHMNVCGNPFPEDVLVEGFNMAVHVWGGATANQVTCQACNLNANQTSGGCFGSVTTTGSPSSQDLPISTSNFLQTGANQITVDCLVGFGAAIHSFDVTAFGNVNCNFGPQVAMCTDGFI